MRSECGRRAAVLGAVLAVLVGCGGGGGAPPASQPPAGQQPSAAPGDGLQTSLTGYVSKVYPAGRTECVTAIKAALQRLELRVTEDSGGMFETQLDAEAKDGTSLVITATEVTKDTTRVAIKVGYLLGNRDAARRVHSEIETELTARGEQEEERRRRWGTVPGPGAR